ncbi:peptide-methionine (S)-S-oxide reductase [Polaribacter sp. PL03]|uniref:peptide-methionine (S)-S-oxide reductase n=1 Tax=Polaribacter sp. PL03 TaxID=3088353 RepID=UPI0029D15559|nr:peptide-methionine (S)-S-oxide reductase [Polaribacter sp. PL03]MDX6748042.1 peptide-methionine (S)-S-oxide reductase [Polaribacter sp. PL03]
MELTKIAFGGGCHWCTEAVFQTLIGVEKVEQGWVSSTQKNNTFSEAVIIHFNTEKIALKTLIEIHLLTHKSTSNHSMRTKYRSAIYYFTQQQKEATLQLIEKFQESFNDKIITKTLEFKGFKPSSEEFQNYYQSNPNKPFCKTYINPKLRLLLQKFSKNIDKRKVLHLIPTT